MKNRSVPFFYAIAVTAVILCSAVPSPAGENKPATGIEGVAAFRGDLVSGATVLAFSDPGPGRKAAPVAVSGGTDESGQYRLNLGPGSYYLVAAKHAGDLWPPRGAPGDLFCYYLGNPIVVKQDKMTRVGFNMVAVRAEETAAEGKDAGIEGTILFEDKPLARAYVYAYRDGSTNFRGMGLAALPTGDGGRFRLKLAPGRYYILSRKRQGGGIFGPPGKNDYIGYYTGNPVDVRPGEFRKISLETTTRVDLLEEVWFTEEKGAGWFRGATTDSRGNPVPGQYVLFYTDPGMAGAPAFVAGPTDARGEFKVRAAEGEFYLLARSQLGGPPADGEWYGKYKGPEGERNVSGDSERKIRIEVNRYRGP